MMMMKKKKEEEEEEEEEEEKKKNINPTLNEAQMEYLSISFFFFF
jgi:hypothetical protein